MMPSTQPQQCVPRGAILRTLAEACYPLTYHGDASRAAKRGNREKLAMLRRRMGVEFFSRQVGPVWKNCFARAALVKTILTGRKNAAGKRTHNLLSRFAPPHYRILWSVDGSLRR